MLFINLSTHIIHMDIKCNYCNKVLTVKEYDYRQKYFFCNDECKRRSLLLRSSKCRKNHRLINRAKYNQLKCDMGCCVCGLKEGCCLDFHHLRDKKIEVGRLINNGRTDKYILEEISKCVVLCANCHRKVHAGIIKL